MVEREEVGRERGGYGRKGDSHRINGRKDETALNFYILTILLSLWYFCNYWYVLGEG